MKLGRDLRGYVKTEILGLPLEGLLDSGASRTLVSNLGLRTLRDAGLNPRPPSRFKFISVANKGTSPISGELDVPFNVGGVVRVVRVLVVPRLSTPLILGLDFWRRFQLRADFITNTVEVGEVGLNLESPREEENEPGYCPRRG